MAIDFRNPDFSLRQLQYVVAVAQTGGFGSAAERCGVSQPSLSVQVAKLEDVLGVQLFERHSRGVLLTAAGRELVPQMREVLGSVRDLDDAAAVLADPYSRPLVIGVIPTVAPYLVPGVVERLVAREPRPRIHWMELQTEACEAALAEGTLDAMVIADPPTQDSVESVDLGFEPFVMLVPVDHPLRGPATVDEIPDGGLLLLEDGHCLRDQAMSLCLRDGVQESPYRGTSLPTVVQMVASGLGISVLPASAVRVESARARVRCVPFAGVGIGRTLTMGWRARTPHKAVLHELVEVFRTALEEAIGR